MKINIFMFEGHLAFSFDKTDLKTTEDRKAICCLIDHLYNMNCVMVSTDDEDLDNILSLAPNNEVSLTVVAKDGCAELYQLYKVRS